MKLGMCMKEAIVLVTSYIFEFIDGNKVLAVLFLCA